MTPEEEAKGRARGVNTNRRRKQERLARELREFGWVVTSPYGAELPPPKTTVPKPYSGPRLTADHFVPDEVYEAMQVGYAAYRARKQAEAA